MVECPHQQNQAIYKEGTSISNRISSDNGSKKLLTSLKKFTILQYTDIRISFIATSLGPK